MKSNCSECRYKRTKIGTSDVRVIDVISLNALEYLNALNKIGHFKNKPTALCNYKIKVFCLFRKLS